MPDAAPTPEASLVASVHRHGIATRIVMVLGGAVFVVAFAPLSVVVLVGAWRGGAFGDVAGAALVGGLLLAVTAYGGGLVLRGARGYTQGGAIEAAQAWMNRHWLGVGLAGAVFLAASFLGGVLHAGPGGMVWLQRAHGDPAAIGLWWLLLGLVALPFHVVVHELGHVLAGWLARFRFVSLRLGPVCLRRDGAGLRVGWLWPLPLEHDGFVTLVPDGDRLLRARTVIVSAAGPFANAAIAALAAALVARAPSPVTAGAAIGLGLATGLAWSGVFVCVLNLVPFELATGMTTDGARIVGALARSAPGMAEFRIGVAVARGLRPRAWGWRAADLLKLAGQADGRAAGWLRYHAFLVALDQGDVDGAAEAHRALVERRSTLTSALVTLVNHQAALSDALDGAAVNARALLGQLASALGAGAGPLGLLEAVVALADGDASGARAALARWAQFRADCGLGAAGQVGFEWVVEALDARLAAAGAIAAQS